MPKTSARERVPYRCADCGWEAAKWVGRCGECQAWGTVEEVRPARLRAVAPGPVTTAARPIVHVDVAAATGRPTSVPELDRVLGGGLVPGAVVLVAGEPGVGKSTLLLDVASRFADPGETSLVRDRRGVGRAGTAARRPDRRARPAISTSPRRPISRPCSATSTRCKPALLVVDSVQTIGCADIDGAPGGVTQVREVAAALSRVAKERGIAVVLVGHVTKDGAIAGPGLLEHLVDVVLHFEGERHARLRMVRAVKNRFGPTDEVGCFDLSDAGIVGLPDPSALFVTRHRHPGPRHLRHRDARGSATPRRRGPGPRCRDHVRHRAPRPPRPGHRASAMVLAVLEKRGRRAARASRMCMPRPSAASG